MKKRDLNHFETQILARMDELENLSENSRDARGTVVLDQQSVGRLSRMDAIERKSMADATNRIRKQEIQMLKAALKRMEEGDFGYCIDCGESIETDRLAKNPAVLKCIDCARG